MTTQHTPGPWKGGFAITGSNGNPVCRVVSTAKWESKTDALKYGCGGFSQKTSNEEATANAKLIAAAPDLFEALLDVCVARNGDEAEKERAWDKAHAAIDKATP